MRKLLAVLLAFAALGAQGADIFKFPIAHPFSEMLRPTTNQTVAADTQNEGIAAIFTMPEDATITTVGFVNGSKTGTPADNSYTVSIQGLTTAGVPDGTVLGGGSPASLTFPNATNTAASFGTATAHSFALANSIALQRGSSYALVIQRTGATDASNFLTLRYGATPGGSTTVFPYTATADSTPTWTKGTNFPFYWYIRSASKTYLYPQTGTGNVAQTFGTTSEVGCAFTMPSGFGSNVSFGLVGVRIPQGTTGMATGNTFTVTLYSGLTASNPTILQQTTTIDSDFVAANTASATIEVFFPEDSLSSLVPGTQYGIGFSNSGAAGSSITTITIPAAGDAGAYPMGGYPYISRTLASAYPPDSSDGAFTVATTQVCVMEPIFAVFTPAPAGGGGGIY